jgi:hypothetical protein
MMSQLKFDSVFLSVQLRMLNENPRCVDYSLINESRNHRLLVKCLGYLATTSEYVRQKSQMSAAKNSNSYGLKFLAAL